MKTMTRKQREMKEREDRILEIARSMLLDGGYHGLNMDRIAAELEYAKGTIYNHFRNKEEIIIALANQSMDKRTSMFERAALFQGLSRERLCAIGVAAEQFVTQFPEHFKLEQLIRSTSIWQKTSEVRREVLRSCERRCVSTIAGIVRDGIAREELKLQHEMTPEDIVFALWSINWGAFSIMTTTTQLADLGIRRPVDTLGHSIDMMLDGYGWRPLSKDHDYRKVERRVMREIFADEQAA